MARNRRPTGEMVSVAALAAPAALAIGALAGWWLDIAWLRSGFGSGVAMNPATAASLLLASISAWSLVNRRAEEWMRAVGFGSGLLVALVGALKLVEIVAGAPIAVDRVLFPLMLDRVDEVPNRMAPNTALAFLLTGVSLLLLRAPGQFLRLLARTQALVTGIGSLVVLFAYGYQNLSLAGLPGAIPMAANTAAAFVMLSTAIVMLTWRGSAATSTGEGHAVRQGMNAVIAVAVLILILTGGFSVIGGVQYQHAARERKESFTRQVQLIELQAALHEAERGEGGFLVTDNPESLAPFRDAGTRLLEHLEVMKRSESSAGGAYADRLAVLEVWIKERLAQLTQIAELATAGRSAEANTLVRSDSGRATMDRIQTEIAGMREAANASVARWDAQVQSTAPLSVFTNLVAVVLAVIFLVLAGLAINSDMRKREEAEAAVRESERRLTKIIELIPSMVFIKEAESLRFVRLNRAGEELLGVNEAEVLGKNDFDLYPEDVAKGYTAFDRAALGSADVVDLPQQHVLTRHRGERILHTRKVAVHDDAGRPLYIVGNSVDITDRLRADAALRQAKDGADAANRAKSDFLAKMSHELRTPLNSIIGFSEILEDGAIGELNEKQRRYVGNVLASGRNLLQLINDILDLSKVEAGRMELSPVAFDAGTALAEVRALVAALAEKKQLTVSLDVAPRLARVHADPARFRQIMFNLVGNAIKFTPEGGRIDITAAAVSDSTTEAGEWLEIAVRDTGIGIAPEHHERIFGEFEQVHDSSATDQPGTGLGLALTRKLVELHAGQLRVESTPGKGSTFTFTLPTAATGSTQPSENGAAAGPLVLVVDDQLQARDLLSHLLSGAGYRVTTTSGSEDVVGLARELNPDAITLDIVLPGRDGLETLADLKADPDTKDVPIVIVSVTDRNELGFALGAADWLIKPVHRSLLLSSLQRVIGPAPASSVQTVLVVDDEPSAREYAAEILSQRGFGVMTASDGRLGIELALAHRPDLVILDLMMPGMNGFDVVHELRRHPEAASIPILILTSKDLTGDERRMLHESVSAIVPKTGGPELLAELQRICPPRQAQR